MHDEKDGNSGKVSSPDAVLYAFPQIK